MFAMCLLALMATSLSVKAQEITITLSPYWNWISYPHAVPMELNEALGDFVPAEGDIIKSRDAFVVYQNGVWSGVLTHFMPGRGYMYRSARTETVSFVFATPSSSVVATATPTDVTAVSAVAGGMVMLPEGSHVFLRGVCWGTGPNPDIDGNHTTDATGIGSFTTTLDGLNPNTSYYVRAYAVSDYGLAYGNVTSFTTLGGIPEVNTAAVTNVSGNGATCGGTVTDSGGLEVTARGVCWSTSHNPTLSDSHTADGTGIGSFVSNITGLSTNTTYYVRAYATTTQATSYGEELTFTTMNGIPAVSTAEVTDITATTATCGGTVTTDGGLTITACGVCWGMSTNPTIADAHSTDGTGTGSFVSTLTGLTPNTTYYVRAYATNSHVTMYGNELSFTTEAGGSGGNAPTGAIDGLFSVSASQQVYFSQGNLQYHASTDTWRFAENQWDYVGSQNPEGGNPGGTVTGSDNSNISSTYSGWIDLFGWGTSGYNHGANCYQPWSASRTHSNYYAYGSYTYNLYDQTGQADWGYNPISNGGNQSNQWRTLTQPEWAYVFNTRTTTSGIRYAKANVNNVNGVILLPDDWNTSTYSLNSTNTYKASFSSNTLTASQWSTLEQAGAVFLPAAGYRYGTSVYAVGSDGCYWSASYSNSNGAYYVVFHDSYLDTTNGNYRYGGVSVRLARVAE